MFLNTLAPNEGEKKDRKRVGRGIGCGWGKTCGRGHKGGGALLKLVLKVVKCHYNVAYQRLVSLQEYQSLHHK